MILRELEQAQARADASLDPLADTQAETCPHCVALWRTFVSEWRAAGRETAVEGRSGAYILLNSWRDNAFADAFAEAFPDQAARRTAVPDPFFVNQEDEAPVLLPVPDLLLPNGLPAAYPEAEAEQWMARQLTVSCHKTAQRLGVVPIGAVLVSDRPVAELASHLLALGMQPTPIGGAAVFRYQDPAIMQLLWPVLDDVQRAAWLGPVTQWWSLRQYWEPWDLLNPPPCDTPWWRVQTQRLAETSRVARPLRLDAAQWNRAGFHRSAQESWMELFIDTPDVTEMPEGPLMLRMLADAAALGLTSNDALKDYIWLTWRGAHEGVPVDWTTDPFRTRMRAALDLLAGAPGLYLSSAYHEIVRPTTTP